MKPKTTKIDGYCIYTPDNHPLLYTIERLRGLSWWGAIEELSDSYKEWNNPGATKKRLLKEGYHLKSIQIKTVN